MKITPALRKELDVAWRNNLQRGVCEYHEWPENLCGGGELDDGNGFNIQRGLLLCNNQNRISLMIKDIIYIIRSTTEKVRLLATFVCNPGNLVKKFISRSPSIIYLTHYFLLIAHYLALKIPPIPSLVVCDIHVSRFLFSHQAWYMLLAPGRWPSLGSYYYDWVAVF